MDKEPDELNMSFRRESTKNKNLFAGLSVCRYGHGPIKLTDRETTKKKWWDFSKINMITLEYKLYDYEILCGWYL